MINAIEARNKAKKRLDEIVSSQLQKIEELVLNACEAGYFYASYDFVLKEETEKSLMDLGYNFKGDGDNKVIEWEFIDSEDNNPIQEEEFFFSDDDEVGEGDGVNSSDAAAEVTVEDSIQDEAESSVEEVSEQDESEDFAEEVVPQNESEDSAEEVVAQNESEDSAEEVVPQDETDDSTEEDTSQDETESFTFEDYSENKEDVVETADATEANVIE